MYRSGQRSKAMKFVSRAIEREPGDPHYQRLPAWMYMENGDAVKADEESRAAVLRAPADVEFLVFRRRVLNRIEVAESLPCT
jgi:Tfp pilus assembly protein PilF